MQIKTCRPVHRYIRTRKITSANSKFLADTYGDLLQNAPRNWKIEKLKNVLEKNSGLTFSRFQIMRATSRARKLAIGDESQQYALLWRYAVEIMKCDPERTVKIKPFYNDNGDAIFKRIYTCWGALKNGWLSGC